VVAFSYPLFLLLSSAVLSATRKYEVDEAKSLLLRLRFFCAFSFFWNGVDEAPAKKKQRTIATGARIE
jgi:hypothetical protein